MTIYVFFPEQYDPDKPTNFPGSRHGRKHRIIQQWTDHILLPAFEQVASAGVAQHIPTTWLGARMRA
jgi:hypothetical protein